MAVTTVEYRSLKGARGLLVSIDGFPYAGMLLTDSVFQETITRNDNIIY